MRIKPLTEYNGTVAPVGSQKRGFRGSSFSVGSVWTLQLKAGLPDSLGHGHGSDSCDSYIEQKHIKTSHA